MPYTLILLWKSHELMEFSCFDRLSTNGKSPTIASLPPFALSLSKGERRVFQQPARGLVGGLSPCPFRLSPLGPGLTAPSDNTGPDIPAPLTAHRRAPLP